MRTATNIGKFHGSTGRALMSAKHGGVPPILAQKHYSTPSAFTPESLLREARRQKRIADASIPPSASWIPTATWCAICLPAVRPGLTRHGRAITRSCISFSRGGIDFGIVGCAVGASFAVLIAEEMFASGCKLLISVTSSGQIVPVRPPPYFILIERALRDEGTSYHYMAASEYSHADPALIAALDGAFDKVASAGACRRDLDNRCSVP